MVEVTIQMPLEERATLYRALGDEHRLRIVDSLIVSDRTPGELMESTGLSSNLLAFHLHILEEARVVERRRSEGDARRRYVHVRSDLLESAGVSPNRPRPESVVFVCTHNSARSQFAEALWRSRSGGQVWSAGADPSRCVHPQALETGRSYGVDLSGLQPKGYEAVPERADLVVSVCDRAFESGVPIRGDRMHWSVPDPVGRDPEAFHRAFTDITGRIETLWSGSK